MSVGCVATSYIVFIPRNKIRSDLAVAVMAEAEAFVNGAQLWASGFAIEAEVAFL